MKVIIEPQESGNTTLRFVDLKTCIYLLPKEVDALRRNYHYSVCDLSRTIRSTHDKLIIWDNENLLACIPVNVAKLMELCEMRKPITVDLSRRNMQRFKCKEVPQLNLIQLLKSKACQYDRERLVKALHVAVVERGQLAYIRNFFREYCENAYIFADSDKGDFYFDGRSASEWYVIEGEGLITDFCGFNGGIIWHRTSYSQHT
jgi:hypothetical protein